MERLLLQGFGHHQHVIAQVHLRQAAVFFDAKREKPSLEMVAAALVSSLSLFIIVARALPSHVRHCTDRYVDREPPSLEKLLELFAGRL